MKVTKPGTVESRVQVGVNAAIQAVIDKIVLVDQFEITPPE